jgi:hypothetical protein
MNWIRMFLLLIVLFAWAHPVLAQPNYQPKNRRTQGGAVDQIGGEMDILSGGVLNVLSGATLNVTGTLNATGSTTLTGAIVMTGTESHSGAETHTGSVTVNATDTAAGAVRLTSTTQCTGTISYTSGGSSATVSGMAFGDTNYAVLLEPTNGVTPSAIVSKTATGFQVNYVSTSTISGRFFAIHYQ